MLEDFASRHPHHVSSLLEYLRGHWNRRAAAGTIEQVSELPITSHVCRKNSLARACALENHCSGPVPEQDARRPILPVDARYQILRADNQSRRRTTQPTRLQGLEHHIA